MNLTKQACRFAILLMIVTSSCTSDMEYKRELWEETDSGFSSPYRDRMLKDLITNHKLKGMKTRELLNLLGPADDVDKGSITYRIKIEYGGDTDPIYIKNLQFSYSTDSLVTSFKILEWKKGE